MSVAQVVSDARAIIVTAPQEVALADVRKAINFCRNANLVVLGLLENMSGLICPHCGGEIYLFRQGGGQRTATAKGIPFLGSLPFDLRVMEGGDLGLPLAESPESRSFSRAMTASSTRLRQSARK
jgi:ATP-binding protein involved in chromosome partitioning